MSNGYQYIDTQNSYIDPHSGILKNLPGLTDEFDLLLKELILVELKAT